MGRPAKYSQHQILDTALHLVSEGGPQSLSVAGIATRLGAPSGSIYHRFASRDFLAASLWLRTVEHFQDGYLVALEETDAMDAARAGARYVLEWSRQHVSEAQLLLTNRSSDLLREGWPQELNERNIAQRNRAERAVKGLARRFKTRTTEEMRRVVFGIVDIPYGAVRGPLIKGEKPPSLLDSIVDDAVVAVLAPLQHGDRESVA